MTISPISAPDVNVGIKNVSISERPNNNVAKAAAVEKPAPAQSVEPEPIETPAPLNLHESNLSFSVDEELGQVIVKVINADTNEVIRQIPAEELIAIARAIDKLQGLLVKQKA